MCMRALSEILNIIAKFKETVACHSCGLFCDLDCVIDHNYFNSTFVLPANTPSLMQAQRYRIYLSNVLLYITLHWSVLLPCSLH